MPTPFAIAVAVGPDPKELDRVDDLIDSIRTYEPGHCYFVMVDDGTADRKLATHFGFPPNWTPISVPHPRRQMPERAAVANRGKGICSAVLQGLSWIAKNASDARFTLKLDTDALVIAPFSQKLNELIAARPNVGMIGAYDRTPSGTLRDISRNAETVRRLHTPMSIFRRLRNVVGRDEKAVISRLIGAARRNGYEFGEHCLGGAYAISGEMLSRLNRQGYLDRPDLWLPIDCPEDVMAGIYTKIAGCDFQNFVGTNEVFGVRHRGLDDTPQRLLDRGYSVIHAVKNDTHFKEEEIRDFYRAQRRIAAKND